MFRVLIVDDSAFARAKVRGWLQDAGHLTAEATNGAEGLRMALDMLPDCIVLDLLMPEMSGEDVLRALRAQGLEIPVIVCSANIQDGIRRQCEEFGVTSFLAKPPGRTVLLEAMERALPPRKEAAG